ncbi:hypothetical protein ACEV8A_20315 [Vibrio parahaemolyticus]|uniref:hypothetical protein n=1 Tax=Vibrio parahaemolyticus TaxID=670 RepID=UPI00094371D8|nr:hypothetical protein [Vibrio parahaemolyticus]OKY43207.1 hypothetical protein BT101_16840 [Vibrio parahaemolyticus]HCH1197999.1 hypothetical protein [Vibrio parahaemolyticus]
MEKIKYEELTSGKAEKLIGDKVSFEVVGLSGRMGSAVTTLERLIESSDLSCRIYTYGRIAAAGGSLFGGITGVVGVASVIGMVAHNIATYNPDYEIAKHQIDNKLSVTYKKS